MKKPRFFCEHCGAEVQPDEKTCPRCGRFFASVRCPACGFSGEEKLFAGGCPACGYSSPVSQNRSVPSAAPPLRAAGKLPVWVYILTIFSLLFVLALLVVFVSTG
ncbi:MAG: zinc-ribbon domain-containing protein [Treponema sp.]|jgi:predicted amidophosphoribosyltransferase|nr:zinc-ribbon domain-containing protein [Treponema sp.]